MFVILPSTNEPLQGNSILRYLAVINIIFGFVGFLPNFIYGGWSFITGLFHLFGYGIFYIAGGVFFLWVSFGFFWLMRAGLLMLKLDEKGRAIIARASIVPCVAAMASLTFVPFFHTSLIPIVAIPVLFFGFQIWYFTRADIREKFSNDNKEEIRIDKIRLTKEIVTISFILVLIGFPSLKFYQLCVDKSIVKRYDLNGNFLDAGHYEIDGFTGIRKIFHNGHLYAEVRYKNGIRNGLDQSYHTNQKVEYQRMYINDRLEWEKYFDENGYER